MSTVENVFSFFRSPHLETHTIEITLDHSTQTHTQKKKQKKKKERKNRVYQRYSSFDAKRTLKVRALKVR